MTRRGWHITGEGETLTVARRMPLRFDLCVATRLPDGGRLRVATQIRQDMWRALQGLRGFAPAVQVTRRDGGLDVLAGGQVTGRVAKAQAEARIAEVLENPGNRARWIRCAS